MDGAGVRGCTPDRDIRFTSAPFRSREDDDAFKDRKSLAVFLGDHGQFADGARRIAQNLALQFRIRAFAQDDDVAGTARGGHDPLEAFGQREQRHEHDDDQGNAADGHGGGAFSHGDTAETVGQRYCHGHTLRSASVALSRIPAMAGARPLTTPVTPANPIAASMDSLGKWKTEKKSGRGL